MELCWFLQEGGPAGLQPMTPTRDAASSLGLATPAQSQSQPQPIARVPWVRFAMRSPNPTISLNIVRCS